MFGNGGVSLINSDFMYLLMNNIFLLIIFFIASTDIPKRIGTKLTPKSEIIETVLEIVFLIMLLGLSIAYLVNSSYNPFLYFKF